MHSREKEVLPRLVAPPVFLYMWLLVGLLLLSALCAWYIQVPAYVTGSGILRSVQTRGKQSALEAILFLPPANLSVLRIDQPVELQVEGEDLPFNGNIDSIIREPISPQIVRQRYSSASDLTITGPSLVVTVKVITPISPPTYEGSVLSARIQVGSQRVLSLLSVFGSFLGA